MGGTFTENDNLSSFLRGRGTEEAACDALEEDGCRARRCLAPLRIVSGTKITAYWDLTSKIQDLA